MGGESSRVVVAMEDVVVVVPSPWSSWSMLDD